MVVIKNDKVREKVEKALKEGKAVIIKRKGGVKIIPRSPNVVVIEVEGE